MIALTDGNDTASRVPPDKAAEIAKDKGVVIHTVSVGDPQSTGEDALDVETLKKVSTTTGGMYAHAADREQLAAIYRQLDALETHKAESVSHRPRRDVFWWPLALGVAITALQQAYAAITHQWRDRTEAVSAQRQVRDLSRRSAKAEEVAA
jgi:Ca-activated chloride channel family protein